jgi:ABC-2 type transport system ATP-binding protein
VTTAQSTPDPIARSTPDPIARSTPDPIASERGVPALWIAGLAKSFGDTAAVGDVELTVTSGSFLGLVGPNGAGKTTLLSMAIGLLRPDRGTAFVLGEDVWSKSASTPAKQLIGALPDGLALPQRLTGAELLTYLGLLRGLPEDVVRERAAELLDVLDLAHAGRTLIADYSTGMRKKIGLASALLHGPKVLVLDEPFEAVDPVSAAVVRAILDGFLGAGGTVVMSTHVMALVEQVCDQVAIMAHGRILRTGTLSQVRGGQTLEDAFAELVGAAPARGLSWFAS